MIKFERLSTYLPIAISYSSLSSDICACGEVSHSLSLPIHTSRDNRHRSRHLLIILGSACNRDGTFHVRLLKNHFGRFMCPLVSFLLLI